MINRISMSPGCVAAAERYAESEKADVRLIVSIKTNDYGLVECYFDSLGERGERHYCIHNKETSGVD